MLEAKEKASPRPNVKAGTGRVPTVRLQSAALCRLARAQVLGHQFVDDLGHLDLR